MISNHIEDIITAIAANPNGIWRNKALSHARDTLAAVLMMEMDTHSSQKKTANTEHLNGLRNDLLGSETGRTVGMCLCSSGMVNAKCPLHGWNYGS